MKRRACLVLPSLIAGLSPAAATAAAPPVKLTGITENLPPLNYLDEDGPQGFSVELLRLMAAQAGFGLEIQVLPWVRAVQLAEVDRNSVLFSLTRTPEREAQFQWVGPIAERRILLYKLANRADLKLTQLGDLGSSRIGVVRDSAADRQLQAQGLRPGQQLEHGLDDATNLRKLLAGRMEYIVLLDWAAAWNLRQLQLPYDTLQPVLTQDNSRSYYYGLRPDANPALVRRLQAALDSLRRDGRYDRLRQRYFR
ncbi:substrate-binding periplasmic protein [Roseateles sp. BYS78W]|uniref:Substrate-binding periplasmic protein n=1 Tax=Pelomonas candidula TaxID=3299025 RepID=A0ABW7H6A5_9BURK